MSDLDPKPPNLSMPPKPHFDVIRPKKAGSNVVSKLSHRRFKKDSKKSNNKATLGMSLGEDITEEEETKDIEVKEAVCEEENSRKGVVDNQNEVKLGDNGEGLSVGATFVSMNVVNEGNSLPTNFNVSTNPCFSNNVNESGEDSEKNTDGSDNNSGKNVNDKGIESNDVVSNGDVAMNEKASPKKPMSFARVVQGSSSYGDNKLRITASMCENAYGRANFARVLVEVDASNDLVNSIEVCYRSLGKSMMLDVEYAWVPPMCSHCKVFGHSFERCGNRIITQEEVLKRNETKNMAEKGANNEGKNIDSWKTVVNNKNNTNVMGDSNNNTGQNSNGTSYGRRRFNSTGSSGSTRNVNVQQDSVKENLTKKVASNGGNEQNNMTKGKVNGEISSQKKNVEKKNVEKKNVEKKNVEKKNVEKKNVEKKNGGSNNRYAVLENEIKEEENSHLWQEMKMKIDLSFDLGIPCSEDEISLWSKDVYDYYKQKCAALEKSKKCALCKNQIKVLEERIADANNNINQVVMAKAKSLVDGKMKAEKLNREQALSSDQELLSSD
ncbi:hypothetical protein CTI12_AA540050 [Artemisia annua]|uniref:Zinc knuckle CX2CX4HX4C n=1 Tax=Artemisia annua TaxID=35608 RepID=A0A2U1L1W5_ARTAN|nr:hypothetical protein CTI12_AA540050 [Artemisia annua]